MSKDDYVELGVKYDNKEHVIDPTKTKVYANRALPDAEIKGKGVVISKDGKIRHGSNTIKRGG